MPKKRTQSINSYQDSLIMQIKQEIEGIKKSENFPDDNGRSFVLWILMNYFDLDRETAITKLIDSPNDKRVDAFIEEDETINILQCKFFNDLTKKLVVMKLYCLKDVLIG